MNKVDDIGSDYQNKDNNKNNFLGTDLMRKNESI